MWVGQTGVRGHGGRRPGVGLGVGVAGVVGAGSAGVGADGRGDLAVACDRGGDVGLREGPGVVRIRVSGMGGHRVGRHGVSMVGPRLLVEHASRTRWRRTARPRCR